MKLKRKGIAILLIAAILSSLLPNLISYAAEPSFTMNLGGGTATEATAEIGETVNVDISFTNGLENQDGLTVILQYDKEALEVILDATGGALGSRLVAGRSIDSSFASNFTIAMGMVENDKGQTTLNFSEGIEKVASSGKLGTIKFKVLKSGSHDVSFQGVSFVRFEGNPADPDNPNEVPTNLLNIANKFTIKSKVDPTGFEIYDGTNKLADNNTAGAFSMNKGTTKNLTAKLLPDGATGEIEWSVRNVNGNAITVDKTGKVTANAKGSAFLDAKIKGTNISTSCYVTVRVALTGINIKEGNNVVTSKSVNVGNSITLSAEKVPADADGEITWSSSDSSKVAIDGEIMPGTYIGNTVKLNMLEPTTTPVTITASCGSITKTCTITVTNNLNDIVFTKDGNQVTEVGIAIGDDGTPETATIVATKNPEETTDVGAITWESENTNVATVASPTQGIGNKTSQVVVTAAGNGETNLVAKITKQDGTEFTKKLKVKVAAHISAITITEENNTTEFAGKKLDLEKGKSKTLGTKFTPQDVCDAKTINYTSSDDSTVKVENGVITALKVGTATITATSVNGKTDTLTVTVPEVPADSVSINGADSINLIRNDDNEKTKKLTVTVGPNNTTDTIEWTSSDPTKVTVDSEGNITAVAVTTTPVTITAKAKAANGTDRGMQDTVEVTVTADLESIILNKTNFLLETGETAQGADVLSVTKNPTDASVDVADVVWKSLNEDVATVANGIVTASNDKPGTAVITATLAGKTVNCEVKVVAPLTGVEIKDSGTTLALKRKQSQNLTVEYTPEYATDITENPVWSSSDADVAEVDQTGKVTAKKAGTATITVNYGKPKDKNGTEKSGSSEMTATRTVSVTEVHADTMEIETLIPLINRKDSQTIKLLFTNTDGSDEEVTDDVLFESSDPTILAVDENGKITGIKKGTATITITCIVDPADPTKNIVKTMAVEVKEIPITSLDLTAENTTLEEGDIVQIYVGCNPKNTTDDKVFTYETSNASIATVSSTGLVTAKKAGEVVITVTAQNGVKSQISLIIKEKPVPQAVPGAPAGPAAAPAVEGLTNSPHTGDMNILGPSAMMIISLAGMVLVIKKK